jgi:hypothetical protein
MSTRPEVLTALATVAMSVVVRPSYAQPNLPPPPPPPIGQSNDVPSLPPPPAPSTSGHAPAPAPTPAPRKSTPPPPPPAIWTGPHRVLDEPVYVEPQRGPIALTLDPLDLISGRLSANVEIQVQPHHAIIASANALVFDASRGGPHNVVSEGFGFATNLSSGFGVELGYHYWVDWARALRGPFVGPSFLFGGTSQASVGDPSHAQPYWGLALDGGWQEVFAGGFTAGGGGGLEMIRMAGTSAVVPRFLIQLGWSF